MRFKEKGARGFSSYLATKNGILGKLGKEEVFSRGHNGRCGATGGKLGILGNFSRGQKFFRGIKKVGGRAARGKWGFIIDKC